MAKDIFDWIAGMAAERRRRICPECGGFDVKFAVHDQERVGCDYSAHCNRCGNEEAFNSAALDNVMHRWHLLPESPYNDQARFP